MKFDRNTVLGFIVLGILFIGYFYYNSKEQNEQLAWKKTQDQARYKQDSAKRAQDSIIRFRNPPPTTDTMVQQKTTADSTGFLSALQGTEQTIRKQYLFAAVLLLTAR